MYESESAETLLEVQNISKGSFLIKSYKNTVLKNLWSLLFSRGIVCGTDMSVELTKSWKNGQLDPSQSDVRHYAKILQWALIVPPYLLVR